MNLGYARVSTHEQTLDLQLDALQQAGCDQVYTDTISGMKDARPGLDQVLRYARSGDVIVVWKLDRLGRSLKHLIEVVEDLEKRGVGFKTLTENLDTTTPGGKLIFHIFGALAEFERNLIRERTLAGLTAARDRGRKGGRNPIISDDRRLQLVKQLAADKSNSVEFICRTLGISRATFYRYLKAGRPA